MKSILLSLCLVAFTSSVYAAKDVHLPEFEQELEKNGVTNSYSEQSFNNLINFIRKEYATLNVSTKQSTKSKNLTVQLDKILAEAELAKQGSEGDKVSTYRNLKSLAYSLVADLRPPALQSGGVKISNVIGGSVKLPYVSTQNRNSRLTEAQTAMEAYNLVDASTGNEYARPNQLVGLSVEQISRLDVREDNSLWYTKEALSDIKREYGTPWAYLEKQIEDAVTRVSGQTYSLDKARRILIYDEIKEDATSPKVNVTDLYGQGWKIKWGEEVHSEPIDNRLYVNLGGKFADLVYTNSGGKKDLILILDAKTKENMASTSCKVIPTASKFKDCLRASKFKFDVTQYVVNVAGKGVVGEGIIDENLWNNPELNFQEFINKKEKLMGREYLVFSESLVEFRPSSDISVRLGATPFSTLGSNNDRVKRALVVFSYWIRNKDAKDENNRGILFNGQYLEFMHDLGASLANIYSSANPNKLETFFASVSGNKVIYDMSVLYKPTAFERASFADQLWMARKILNLSYEDLKSAVDATHWPEFQKLNMLSRIVARRNNIQAVYGENSKLTTIFRDGSIQKSLKTKEDRLLVVREFNIALAFKDNEEKALQYLESVMKLAKVRMNSKGDSKYVDTVYTSKNQIGTTVGCERSIIVSVLESSVRPTGLGRRVSRRSDSRSLPTCYPGMRRP